MASSLMAFDPGGTTGLAYRQSDGAIKSAQITDVYREHEIYEWLELWRPTHVIYERFDHRTRNKVNIEAAYQIGVFRLWCQQRGAQLIEQTPAFGKGFWTDDKIKALGLWQKGMPHAMDAMRHILAYITFTQKDESYLDRLSLLDL